jgi:DNA-binding NarL/FixJ family response regulator
MECELLELVSLGLANKEIAHDLGISPSAVNKRLARLMRRFAVHSRTALVRSALAAGLIALADAREGNRSRASGGVTELLS